MFTFWVLFYCCFSHLLLICLLFMNSHRANTKKLPMRYSCRHVFQMERRRRRKRRRRRRRGRRSEQCLEGETPPRDEDYLIKNSVHKSLSSNVICAMNLCITYSSDHDLSVQLFCSHAGIEASLSPPRLVDRTAALFASFCHINI